MRDYFDSPHLPLGELVHLLRSKAVLMPGVSVTLANEKTRDTQTWQYKGGLKDYLEQSLATDPCCPCSKAQALPMPRTTASPRAKARRGAWPLPNRGPCCAKATSI